MQFQRDLSTVTPASAPELLADGWYPANITAQRQVPNKDKPGSHLEIKYKLHIGRNLTSRHNLDNPSHQTVDIAYSEIAAIAAAVGRPRAQNAQEFVGGPLEIYVKREPRNDRPGEMSNVIKGFRAIGAHGAQPGFSGAAGTQTTAAPTWAAPAAPAFVPPVQPSYAAPTAPAWSPPQPTVVSQPTYAPPPQPAPAAQAPAASGSVPPWAK